MDGNGRWAKKRLLPRNAGHRAGMERLRSIVEVTGKLGIDSLTVYAFSTENWQRSQDEVSALMQLLRDYLDKEFKEIMENNVRIIFIGERNMLAEDIQQKIKDVEVKSANNTALTLCVALSYGSRQEILAAAKQAMTMAVENKLSPDELTADLFASLLYTKEIPDPDILIRTSGEQRISNYLLWQLAYTELFFTKTYWPDFSKEELMDIIEKFNTRERRYGKN